MTTASFLTCCSLCTPAHKHLFVSSDLGEIPDEGLDMKLLHVLIVTTQSRLKLILCDDFVSDQWNAFTSVEHFYCSPIDGTIQLPISVFTILVVSREVSPTLIHRQIFPIHDSKLHSK